MALSFGNVQDLTGFPVGESTNKRAFYVEITFDSSYPTGGEAVDWTPIGLTGDADLFLAEPQDDATSQALTYDRTNNKILAFTDYAGGTQVSGSTDLSGDTYRCLVVGTVRDFG